MTSDNNISNDTLVRCVENDLERSLLGLFQVPGNRKQEIAMDENLAHDYRRMELSNNGRDTLQSCVSSLNGTNVSFTEQMKTVEEMDESLCDPNEALNKLSEALNLINESQRKLKAEEADQPGVKIEAEDQENDGPKKDEKTIVEKLIDGSNKDDKNDKKELEKIKSEGFAINNEKKIEQPVDADKSIIKSALQNFSEPMDIAGIIIKTEGIKLEQENVKRLSDITATSNDNIVNGISSREPISYKVNKTPKQNGAGSNMKNNLVDSDDDDDDINENIIEATDDREGCRSLVCDSNGIIVAEMVYRCMICANVADSIAEAQKHYQVKHILEDLESSANKKPKSPPLYNGNSCFSDLEDYPTSQPSTLTYSVPSGLKQLQQALSPSPNISQEISSKIDKNKPKIRRENEISTQPSMTITPNFAAGSSRGGYVTCAVCNLTKFYASVQRRYGQFTCMGCAKFFGRFLIKPRKYYCPKLGTCPLDQSPRCKACLLSACITTYNIDEKRMKVVNSNLPMKKIGPSGSSVEESYVEDGMNEQMQERSLLMMEGIDVGIKSGAALNDKKSNVSVIAKKGSTGKAKEKRPNGGSGRKVSGCRACSGCLAEDCGQCHYCLDKPKFGGGNTLKKKCVTKRCIMQGLKVKTSDNGKKIRFSRK